MCSIHCGEGGERPESQSGRRRRLSPIAHLISPNPQGATKTTSTRSRTARSYKDSMDSGGRVFPCSAAWDRLCRTVVALPATDGRTSLPFQGEAVERRFASGQARHVQPVQPGSGSPDLRSPVHLVPRQAARHVSKPARLHTKYIHVCSDNQATGMLTYPLTWENLSGWGDSNSRPLDPQENGDRPSRPTTSTQARPAQESERNGPANPGPSSRSPSFCIHFTYIDHQAVRGSGG